jgi:hypothetical protein
VRDDCTLGVGGHFSAPTGRTLDEVWGKAGEPVVFTPAFSPTGSSEAVALMPLLLVTIDEGHELRYYDAWSP